MPPLSNPRHERFAQSLARGTNQTEAYGEAGYVPDRGHASRLASQGSIQERLAEIFDESIPDIIYDRRAINNVYTQLLIQAKKDNNTALRKQIADSIAKVNGLVVTRHETGTAGEFDKLSDNELIEIIATQLGEVRSASASPDLAEDEGE